jgi:branched-chain amino acid transport system ATP-binding protein
VLIFVGLDGHQQQLAGELSPTEQRLLELARALAIGPRLLLIDEPEAGLTEAEQQSLADLLTAVRQQQVTLLMTASTAGPLTALCDRVIPLDR